jgi:hypothetical protein
MLEYARIFAYRTDMNLIRRDGRTDRRTRRTDACIDNPGPPPMRAHRPAYAYAPPLCVRALASIKPLEAHICPLGAHLCPLGAQLSPLGLNYAPSGSSACPLLCMRAPPPWCARPYGSRSRPP